MTTESTISRGILEENASQFRFRSSKRNGLRNSLSMTACFFYPFLRS